LYDAFGFEWTLLCMGADNEGRTFQDAARAKGLDLAVMHEPRARGLYEADFALIRPDQIVAWRGESCRNAARIFDTLLGAGKQVPSLNKKTTA